MGINELFKIYGIKDYNDTSEKIIQSCSDCLHHETNFCLLPKNYYCNCYKKSGA